jgi:2-keto-4-pentenoate hydratase/2-oxohepta-3-ene-1,7-dioic acid hydratase in catechol pathway
MLSPRHVYALGLTYRDHLRETGERPSPDGPAVFRRDPASLIAGDEIRLPSAASIAATLDRLEPGLGARASARHALLDYEVELGLQLLEDIAVRDLDAPVLPIACFIACDLTVRTVQILGEGTANRMAYWSAAKSFPGTFLAGAPVRVADGAEIVLTTTVNGVRRQHSSTAQLLHPPRELLRFLARSAGVATLAAGDVVLTGTPGGIALMVPRWKRWIADRVLDRFGKLAAATRGGAKFLAAGDVVEIDGGILGARRAVVVAGPEAA